jgi:hypothetical protein
LASAASTPQSSSEQIATLQRDNLRLKVLVNLAINYNLQLASINNRLCQEVLRLTNESTNYLASPQPLPAVGTNEFSSPDRLFHQPRTAEQTNEAPRQNSTQETPMEISPRRG